MQFRPTLWATLAIIPALAVLIGLGVWQLQRLDWKEALIEIRAERVISPVIDLVPRTRVDVIRDPGNFEMRLPPQAGIDAIAGDIAQYEYRPIRLAGQFRHPAAMHLVSRTRKGAAGEHVLTPFALVQGGVVLVDRGWVPPRQSNNATREYDRPQGRLMLEGYIRLFAVPGRFTPDNDPATDTWFWLDPDAMSTAVGEEVIGSFYVQAAPVDADGVMPAGSIPEIALRNPHLHYALTWFGVAAALIGVYLAAHITRRDERL